MIINKKVVELLKKEKTKISERVLNYLDKDRTLIEQEDDFFYFTGDIVNYVFNYLKKFISKKLKVNYYIYENKKRYFKVVD